MLGCDDVETDQVVAIAARTTIADAAMILRMKSIAFPVGSTECDRPSACSMSGSLCVGRFTRCDGHHRMFDRRPPAVTLELVTGGATISRRAQHGPPPQDLPDPVDGHSSRPWRRDTAAMRRYEEGTYWWSLSIRRPQPSRAPGAATVGAKAGRMLKFLRDHF